MNIELALQVLSAEGLEVEVVYDGPASACPHCREAELTAAA